MLFQQMRTILGFSFPCIELVPMLFSVPRVRQDKRLAGQVGRGGGGPAACNHQLAPGPGEGFNFQPGRSL